MGKQGAANNMFNTRPMGVAFRTGIALLVLLLQCGCAVYSSNRKSGSESLWGVGRVTWHVVEQTNGCATVSSGVRLPGIVLGISPEFFGISLGYTVRERLSVSHGDSPIGARINGESLPADTRKRWGIGHITLNTPRGRRSSLVTGNASAGLNACVDVGRPRLTAGMHSSQIAEVKDDNAFTLEGGPFRWPYFDYTASEISISQFTNSNPQIQNTTP